ncbi:hypothetical protein GCM10009850_118780 [Nonomuraea monospora]|uniref:Uncharacterized protein n=1 Tax=Nonomuraea monospora TaxID=568818 RepID=A0ABN3D3M3_9ACTN
MGAAVLRGAVLRGAGRGAVVCGVARRCVAQRGAAGRSGAQRGAVRGLHTRGVVWRDGGVAVRWTFGCSADVRVRLGVVSGAGLGA